MQKRMSLGLGLGLAVAAVVVVSGCGGSAPSAVKPPEIAANAGKQAIDQLDANHDNLLDYNELAKRRVCGPP